MCSGCVCFREADYEIVIVEDNSPDGTINAANQLQVCTYHIFMDNVFLLMSFLIRKYTVLIK